jgi:hypothetical protein
LKPHTISTVVVCELRDSPGTYVLIRSDRHDRSQIHIWCGQQYGWLPDSPIAKTLCHGFRSVRKAERASDKLVKLPLRELPVEQN